MQFFELLDRRKEQLSVEICRWAKFNLPLSRFIWSSFLFSYASLPNPCTHFEETAKHTEFSNRFMQALQPAISPRPLWSLIKRFEFPLHSFLWTRFPTFCTLGFVFLFFSWMQWICCDASIKTKSFIFLFVFRSHNKGNSLQNSCLSFCVPRSAHV